jgi:hypothetical protein
MSRVRLLVSVGCVVCLAPRVVAAQEEYEEGYDEDGEDREQRPSRTQQVYEALEQFSGDPDRQWSARQGDHYYVVDPSKQPAPQLIDGGRTVCYQRAGSPATVHVQCDEATRRCLVAEAALMREPAVAEPVRPELSRASKTPGAVKTTLRPVREPLPPWIGFCAENRDAAAFQALYMSGFTLVPALLPAPYGMKRDERGRIFQTHFDLRSRLSLGVQYSGAFLSAPDPLAYQSGVRVELRSTYESWDMYDRKRHRLRFLEGQLTLAPFDAQVTGLEYDRGSSGEEPAFWITTLVGEPERYDVRISLGTGVTLGRLDTREYRAGDAGEARRVTFLDIAEGRLHWELLQGTYLEDYLMLRVGGGMGTRVLGDDSAGALYFYPEVSARSAALIGERGLFQWQLEVRARQAWEIGSGASWRQLTGSTSLEWVMLAISDQPLSLFIQPEVHALDFGGEQIRQLDARFMAGLRLSLFAPTPEPPPAQVTK